MYPLCDVSSPYDCKRDRLCYAICVSVIKLNVSQPILHTSVSFLLHTTTTGKVTLSICLQVGLCLIPENSTLQWWRINGHRQTNSEHFLEILNIFWESSTNSEGLLTCQLVLLLDAVLLFYCFFNMLKA